MPELTSTRNGCARHVVIPREVGKKLNLKRLLSEEEWRALGIQQSRGWVHYAWHR